MLCWISRQLCAILEQNLKSLEGEIFMGDLQAKAKLNRILSRAFDSLAGAKIIVDKAGIILYASKFHYEYLGYDDPEDLIGHYVTEVIPGTRMHIVLQTRMPEYGCIFRFLNRKTGAVTSVVCNYAPIFDGEELIGAMSETTFPQGMNAVLQLSQEIEKLNLRQQSLTSSSVQYNVDELIIGTSPSISALKQMVKQVASFPLPVLITGETGTGKEVFANAIHQLDSSRKGRFVKINCAAIPRDLLESELFGYEEGAFSGAVRNGKIGKFEYAQNGSVLLDEIGDMPLDLQAKLLRALQEKSFEKVGGVESIPFNARVICTTNCDLRQLIQEKKFREDLYYRINVIEMHIPPLRERKEDIDVLCNYFIDRINRENGLSIVGIEAPALEQLRDYPWPGNVRELRHLLERSCFMRGAGILTKDQFFLQARATEGIALSSGSEVVPLYKACAQAEIAQISRALELAHGNKSTAARLLQIDRSVLYDKIKKYRLE